MFSKCATIAAISAGLMLAQIPTAADAGGARPLPIYFTLDIPANSQWAGQCAFPIRLAIQGKAAVLTLPGNRFIYTAPQQNVTITNMSNTSKTVTFNITGTIHQTVQANGDQVSYADGRNILLDPVYGIMFAVGHYTYVFNSAGQLIQPLTPLGQGRLESVCDFVS